MAKSRRKASGCRAGTFKLKKMGKGWSAHSAPKSLVKYRSKKQADLKAQADQKAQADAAE